MCHGDRVRKFVKNFIAIGVWVDIIHGLAVLREIRNEKRNTSTISYREGAVRVRQYVRDEQYGEGNSRGDMFDVPSVLYGKAEIR